MQKRAARDDLDLGRRNAHGARQGDGVSGYALGVAFSLGVLQVERVAQRFERHVVGVLQVFHRLAQHLGARPHHLLQVLLVVVALLQGLAVVERALHGGDQVFALEGLEQVVVGAAAHGVDGHADVVNGGDHHHREDAAAGHECAPAARCRCRPASRCRSAPGRRCLAQASPSACAPLTASCTSYPWRSASPRSWSERAPRRPPPEFAPACVCGRATWSVRVGKRRHREGRFHPDWPDRTYGSHCLPVPTAPGPVQQSETTSKTSGPVIGNAATADSNRYSHTGTRRTREPGTLWP